MRTGECSQEEGGLGPSQDRLTAGGASSALRVRVGQDTPPSVFPRSSGGSLQAGPGKEAGTPQTDLHWGL